MPQLNKEKLDQMVEAVMKEFVQKVSMFNYAEFELITRTALTPFAMEMTDEEIYVEGDKRSDFMEDWSPYERGFNDGAKFIRDKQIDQ